ncbi:MAG: hypothetical protein KAS86_00600, partial [Candidatus Omnitrophica bacterium]|nr:hypothetical protein [Candidatus Omnitrophota bacterium]
MVDAERSAMRQTPAKAGPRIRLIKAYDSLDKDKKVSGLIDKTVKMVKQGNMSADEAVEFVEYLFERGDKDTAEGLFRVVYAGAETDPAVLLLRARLALQDEPVEAVRVKDGPEDFTEIAVDSADQVLEKDPENIEALLVKMEALKKRYEKDRAEKDREEQAKVTAILAGLLGDMDPEQIERFQAAKIDHKPDEETSARVLARKTKDASRPGEVPAIEEKKGVAPAERKKYTGPEADMERMELLEEKLRRTKKLSSEQRLELAELYMGHKMYSKALKQVNRIKDTDIEAEAALQMRVLCCLGILDGPRWWQVPVFTKYWTLRRAIKSLGALPGKPDAKNWAAWIKNTVYSVDTQKAAGFLYKIGKYYSASPEDHDARLKNRLIEQGSQALLDAETVELETAGAMEWMLASGNISPGSEFYMTVSDRLSKKRETEVQKAAREGWGDIGRERRQGIQSMKAMEDMLDPAGDSYEKDPARRKKLEDEKRELEKEIERLEQDILRGYGLFIQANKDSARMIAETRSEKEFTDLMESLVRRKGPVKFRQTLDSITGLTAADAGKQFLRAVFADMWLDALFRQKYDNEKNRPSAVVTHREELMDHVRELLGQYNQPENTALRKMIADVLRSMAGYRIYGRWDEDEARFERSPVVDHVITALSDNAVQDHAIRGLAAELRLKEAEKSVRDWRDLSDRAEKEEDIRKKAELTQKAGHYFFMANEYSSDLLEYYAEELLKTGMDKEQRESALEPVFALIGMWYGRDPANAVRTLMKKAVSEEEREEDIIGRLRQIIKQIDFTVPDRGKILVNTLVNALCPADKITIIENCGEVLTAEEKLQVILAAAASPKGLTGEEYRSLFNALKEFLGKIDVGKITPERIEEICRVVRAWLPPDEPESLSVKINILSMMIEKKEDLTETDRAFLNERFEELKEQLAAELDNRREEEEKEEIDSILVETERLMGMAGRYGQLGEPGRAENALKQAIDMMNALFRRNIEFTRKEEQGLSVNDGCKEKAGRLAKDMAKVLREQDKYFEAEMMLARGYRLLAEYGIVVDQDEEAVRVYMEKAREALANADKLRPYQAEVSRDMMELEILRFAIARQKLMDAAGKYEDKKKELDELENREKNIETDLAKAREDTREDIDQARRNLAETSNITGDQGAVREKRLQALERAEQRVTKLNKDLKEARDKTKQRRSELAEAEAKKRGFESEEKGLYVSESARIVTAVRRAFQTMANGNYDPADEHVKKAVEFLVSLEDNASTEVIEEISKNIEDMQRSAEALAPQDRLKREVFINTLLLDIHFRNDRDRFSGSLKQIEQNAGQDSTGITVSGKEYGFDAGLLIDHIVKNTPDEKQGELVAELFKIFKAAKEQSNFPTEAAALAAIYGVMDMEGDAELTHKDNFDENRAIKEDKRPDMLHRLRRMFQDKEVEEDTELQGLLVSFMQALRKEKKQWKDLSADRVEKTGFIMDFCVERSGIAEPENVKEGERDRFHNIILGFSRDAEERKKALENIGRQETEKDLPDHGRLGQIADEL